MMIPTAEIEIPAEPAKVDSKVGDAKDGGSAPPATEAGAADGRETQPEKASPSPESERDKGQERFDKLTRERYEAQAEREIERARREAAEAELASYRENESAKRNQVAPDAMPTLESVGYDEGKFVAAITQYLSKNTESLVDARVNAALGRFGQAQQQAQTHSAWDQRQTNYIKSNPDYVDDVQNARVLPISKELQVALKEMDDGPQIAHFLVKNRDKALAIMQLPPGLQLREAGRISAQLEANKPKETPKPSVSQAPPPPAKVVGNEAQVEKSPEDMTDKQFAAWRRKFIK